MTPHRTSAHSAGIERRSGSHIEMDGRTHQTSRTKIIPHTYIFTGTEHRQFRHNHMTRTPSTAATLPDGKCSTPLAPAVKTSPKEATPAAGNLVSTSCAAELPGEIPPPLVFVSVRTNKRHHHQCLCANPSRSSYFVSARTNEDIIIIIIRRDWEQFAQFSQS
jgi:hypothetical protein